MEQCYYPDSLYEELDLENTNAMRAAQEDYLRSQCRHEKVWSRESRLPLKGIYIQALREMALELEHVVAIYRGHDAWGRD